MKVKKEVMLTRNRFAKSMLFIVVALSISLMFKMGGVSLFLNWMGGITLAFILCFIFEYIYRKLPE